LLEIRTRQWGLPAWNKALDHAGGEWICFLGADDYFWRSDVLERMVPHLEAASAQEVRVVYGQVAFVNSKGEILQTMGQPWEKIRKRFRQEMAIPHAGVMHHRGLFAAHGRFDESFRILGDYDLLLRELKSRRARFVPGVVVAGMQIGGLSSASSLQLVHLKEVARGRRNNGITALSPRLLRRVVRARVRSWITGIIGSRNTGLLIDYYKSLKGEPKRWTQ
jgi:hypothetical protein